MNYQSFIQQAYKGKHARWQYLLTLLLVLVGWQLIGILPIAAIAAFHSKNEATFYRAANDNFMGLGIDKNLYLIGMIAMFIIGLGVLFLGVKKILKRSVKTVLTSREKFDWKRFFFGFGVWFMLGLVFIGFDYFMHPEDFVWNFQWQPFLILTLISFLLLPFQTSFEEVLMRGFLMQWIGIVFQNRWVPLLLTSFIFGILHGMNPEVVKIGNQLLVYYILTGLLFGMITLLDEGLELPMGIHAANNIVAALLVTTNWTVFQTDALWIDTSEPNLTMLMYIPLFVIYPLALWVFSKKYQWKDWKNKLIGYV